MASQNLSLNDYINQLQAEQEKAQAANEKRLQEVTSLYDSIIAQYAPGGSFGAGMEAQLKASKAESMSQGAQALSGSGFANSSMMASLGTTWEKKVGNQARLNLEDTRASKLAEAKIGKAGVIERVSDEGPDDSLIASLIQQASVKPSTVTYTAPSKMGSIFDEFTSAKGKTSSAAPVSSTSGGFNSAYWNNGRWTGGPSSSGTTNSGSISESDFQSLVNSNMKKAKKTPNYSYWPEG